jgi:response regulator RpfG family c-di-GMP phosphodiesterase
MGTQILLVEDDDDDALLIGAALRDVEFDAHISRARSIAEVEAAGSDANVALLDLMLPDASGFEGVRALRETFPALPIVVLTGHDDGAVALRAIHEGAQDYIPKGELTGHLLSRVIRYSIERQRELDFERELLEQTLGGAVSVLSEVLSLTSPAAFGRGMQLQRVVQTVVEQLPVEDGWQIQLAAMLSQLGCIGLPDDLLERASDGRMTERDSEAWGEHPQIGRELIQRIPRLKEVAEIVGYQHVGLTSPRAAALRNDGRDLPLGARILKVVVDWDELLRVGLGEKRALADLHSRGSDYDTLVLAALERALEERTLFTRVELAVEELKPGMIVDRPVELSDSTLLVPPGLEVTHALLARIRAFRTRLPNDASVHVLAPPSTTLAAGSPRAG